MKSLLKFITCGSVDDGKSTLIGHILYDSKLLYADQEEALLLDSKVGSCAGGIDYSLLLDGLMAEREQGITIDVAYRYFTTEKRSFIVADTPGHEEYTRNMAVGAAFADLAVILVDASAGVLVQTRRHARICALMGIRHFVFAVNKMDLVDYQKERFDAIVGDLEKLADELSLAHTAAIPVSATAGDNVTAVSKNMPWYEGETVLSYLETVDVSEGRDETFYLPVQRVCRPDHTFRGFQGQVEGGRLAVGDEVIALPSGERAAVKSILRGDKEVESVAYHGAVTVCLDKEVDVSRGCVLTTSDELSAAKVMSVTLLWMDDNDFTGGLHDFFVKIGTKKIPGVIEKIDYRIDVNTGERVETNKLQKNEIARVRLRLAEPAVVSTFAAHRTLGELILIDRVSHATAACGVVETVENEADSYYFEDGELKGHGYIFEEFYFNPASTSFAKDLEQRRVYRVGDAVPISGDSFAYPDYFDILNVRDGLAVLVRDRKIEEMQALADYRFIGLPVLDEGGFELTIKSRSDLEVYLEEAETADYTVLHNRWARFETYRRVICDDNFWII